MKSLEEHNKERQEQYELLKQSQPNGIACPNCGAELWDVGGLALSSYPPKLSIKCKNCGYRGFRLA